MSACFTTNMDLSIQLYLMAILHIYIYEQIIYFRKYGLKIALDEDLTSRIHGDSDLSLMNYEFIYMVNN